MPLTPEERAQRRQSRRIAREEKERKQGGAYPLRNNLQGYQTESARLFGLSVQSSNDSSHIFSSESLLKSSSNDSNNNLDISFDSATKQGRRVIHRNLSGIEEGLESGSMHIMQPPGQDAAQGASPRHNRAGPFDKDHSDEDDDYYDEEEGENNNNGGISTNPFLDDSMDDRGSSPEEREFLPARLDRSGRSSKSNRSGRTSEGGGIGESFDADDDGPSKTARPANLVASVQTTSSGATQQVANTAVDGSNRKTTRGKFMEVMPDDEEDDNRGETVEDYGSPFHNTGPSPFDDDSVNDQASQGSYEQPRAYRPFSGGSQSSVHSGDVSGEHYASMQELLEEERSRSIVGHKTSRCGGCVEKVLGGKRTKRRKITLLAIVLIFCALIGISVWSIVLGPKGTRGSGDGKDGGVEAQKVKPIERPETSFTPNKSGNSSSADSTFGMTENSTDDLVGFEPTFPAEGDISNATTGSTSPTSSPESAPTSVSPEMIIPAEIEPTPPPSDSPTTPEFISLAPVSVTKPPTATPTAAEMTVEPTEEPTAAKTTLQPTGTPSSAPFASPTSGPTTAAPVLIPTNPPIAASVPSVQTDISGLLTFSEPVPQETEADLIVFLDALKKSIRSAVSSSLQPSDELVYVEIISINGAPVDSLLSRRRFIRRRLQFGTLVEYELVVLSDCDSADCTNADIVASDVYSRTTNEILSSVDSGAFASILEVEVLSSSGGSVEYLSGVELGDFSEPKVTVITPAVDYYGANETSSINSTTPVDVISANETDPIDSSTTTDGNTATSDTCQFCKDGMPDPLKVVSTNGYTCTQLKEAVSEEDSESSTCLTVLQAEVLCCAASATASDTIDETTSTNATIGDVDTEVDIDEGNATFTSSETIVANYTDGVHDDINVTETPSMDTTIGGNETTPTNITSGHYLSDHNETMTTNSTYEDFDTIDTSVGNETLLTFDAMPIMYENGTDSGFVNDALWPDLFCPQTLTRSIEIDVFASLFYEVVRPSSVEARNGIFCARLQVKSLGWIGFALSKDGTMIGSEAIIAKPDDNTVLKYSLLGKSSDLIIKVDDNHQTLRDTSVTQDLELGVTTMEFVKHLEEFEEIPILTTGPNYFLYARGWSNVLGYHQGRMSFMKDFAEDVVAVVDDTVSVDLSDNNEPISSNFTADSGDALTPSNVTDVEDGFDDVDGANSTVSTSDSPVSICNFCDNGMPEPFKVVSDSGLTCNQIKEAVADKDSDSNTCIAVKQGEGLCCELSSIVSDTIGETSSTNVTMDSNETTTNTTSEDSVVDTVVSPTNSTLVGNETAVITNSTSTCKFCEDGMPDPLKVVSTNGYTCTQLKETVSDEDSESSTCLTVMQAEVLCCVVSTIVTNYTDEDLGDINVTETPSMDTTIGGNETTPTNITSGHYLSDHNETMTTNSTYEDFDTIDTSVGNETLPTFDAMPIMYENGTDSGFVNDALWPDLFCPQTLTRSIEIDVFASLFYEVVRPSSVEARNGIFCARLQVKSLGWIGFALSKDGTMIGSEAIIAKPDDNTVLKYSLLGKSSDLIIKVDDNHQTLRDTSVTQDLELGVTTMEFVKHLEEFEEIPILTTGPNYFLYARGWSNVLGYHQGRMSFMKDFAEDVVAVVDDTVSVDLSDNNETIPTNFASDSFDFNIGTVVVGNETLVIFDDMPVIYANGTDSGFDNDTLYSDDNSTLDDNDETPTFNNVASNPGDMNSILDGSNGSVADANDVPDLSAILDALSLPYTLSQELGGTSAAAQFGFSVAMSSNGNIMAVGAKNMNEAVLGEGVGAVLLYSMETSPPTLLQTVINEYPNGEFGNSIGLSNDGSRLVVGARSEEDQAGVVRVYGRDSFGQWTMLGMPINGLSSGERAGWSVSISGDGSSVAVGAPKGGGSASGSVVTYRFENGSSWEPYGNVLEGVSKEAFGYTATLSYDGQLVAVGSPKAMSPEGASNAGKVSVFYMYGTEWLPLPAKEIHGISANDIDGTSVALSQDGSILVVGGKGRDNDDGVSNVGHCRIYKFGTEWELLHSMEGQTENERLGSSVAVTKNGNVVACGGNGAMYDGVGIGVVRVWNRETSQSSTVWPRTIDGGALFGSALSLKEDGKILAVGAPERISMTSGSKAGAVDVYRDFII